jgi:hypothetical protein
MPMVMSSLQKSLGIAFSKSWHRTQYVYLLCQTKVHLGVKAQTRHGYVVLYE